MLAALSWVPRENLCVIVGTGVFPHLLLVQGLRITAKCEQKGWSDGGAGY